MSHRHCHRHHNSDDSGLGCVVALILGLIALPIVGLWMVVAGNDDEQRALGIILTIVIIIWIAVAANS